MKYTGMMIAWAVVFGVRGQTEHWQFEDSLSAGGETIRYEVFCAPGKYAVVSHCDGQYSRTVVDSAIRQRLDLYDREDGKFFVRTMIEQPVAEEMEVMEEMRPQPGREGLDFRLLGETKKLFGLTLQRVSLMAPNPDNEKQPLPLGEGWLVIGKTIPTIQQQILSDGRTGVIVESVLDRGTDTHRQRLVGYSAGKTAPQGTFSLTVPEGYSDLNKNTKEEAMPAGEAVKSVVIGE